MQKGKELTPKRKAFADEYLTDLNGTRAYKAVYKNVKSDATAAAASARLLRNVKVKAYIAERMKEIQTEKTADLEEVIRFFSSVMRGEVKDQFDLDATTILMGDNLFTEFKGVMAENYVLQALVRQYGSQHYYWTSGNTAEVEFLLQDTGKIIPIEIKADKNVTAKSLAYYRKQYLPKLSIRLSALNMRKDDDLLNLPLYLVDKLKMFVGNIELNE